MELYCYRGWMLTVILSPRLNSGFTVPEIKEDVNPRKMAVVLENSKQVNGKLNQLKDHLIEFFHLSEVEDDRNKFFKSIEKNK